MLMHGGNWQNQVYLEKGIKTVCVYVRDTRQSETNNYCTVCIQVKPESEAERRGLREGDQV